MQNLNMRKLQQLWRFNEPVITCAIIAICVLMWCIEIITYYFMPQAYNMLMNNTAFVSYLNSHTAYSWFTSMFVHAPNFTHIAFNMMSLWVLGRELEKLMGHWNYLFLYIISGLGGAAAVSLWSLVSHNLMAVYGASGAIFGLFATMFVVYRRTGMEMRSITLWLILNLAWPLFVPNIAWQSHLGGFLAGGILAVLLIYGLKGLRSASLSKRSLIYGVPLAIVLFAGMYAFLYFAF
ncbi:MAG: rhomboid family intramembrane serine protease [Bifidobacteriaceae bacterium]|nr:rhomboid family intramembrane serine protease [Bifidobacteriaceae bacterium]